MSAAIIAFTPRRPEGRRSRTDEVPSGVRTPERTARDQQQYAWLKAAAMQWVKAERAGEPVLPPPKPEAPEVEILKLLRRIDRRLAKMGAV